MSDRPINHELDDELLSAYVDGELSADERATIEARLANDPAAQQLLHELRSVSQSVQALPTETLGRDLSEVVIRRARVVRGSPDPAHDPDRRSPATSETETFGRTSGEVGRPAPNSSVDAMPKIRIFNSRRAWFWASVAVAASLLMMVMQSGGERANKLPPVAARNQEAAQTQPVDEAGKPVRREISITAAPNAKTPSPATVASETEAHDKVDAFGGLKPAAMPSEPRGSQLSSTTGDDAAAGRPLAAASPAAKRRKEDDKAALSAGSASSTVTALSDQVASEKSAAAPQPTGRIGGSGGSLDMADAKQKSESIIDPNAQRFLVVRIVAKPEALRNGSFDRLLASNNIKFVPQPAKPESFSFGGGQLTKSAKNESAFKEQSTRSPEDQPVDMVLVEAPRPAIELCLAELKKNENDFLSINVIEQQESHDRIEANSTPNKKLAEISKHLSDFNRGNVAEPQKDKFDSRKYFYSYDLDKPNEPVVNGAPSTSGVAPGAGAISGVKQDANGDGGSRNTNQPAPAVRRARLIEDLAAVNRQAGEPASPEFSSLKSAGGRAARVQSEANTPTQPMSQRTPNEPAEAKAGNQNNNWKVLFVFTSEETPAPSAPPNNRPK